MATNTTTSWSNNTGVQINRQNFDAIIDATRVILDVEILVGVPMDTTDRPPDLAPQNAKGITNAALAYIHDQGVPEVGIPQREFMRPGIARARAEIERRLAMAMRAALQGNALVAEQVMLQAGTIAQSSIRNFIDAGVPPALSEYTLRKRAARGKGRGQGREGAKIELARRAQGLPRSLQYAKPLVDFGEMRKSIMFVLRRRSARRR